ncbi:aquaporin-3-like isoform X3 [Mya arenaria]|uniref:aquaporin-3-like isoform X3 n=1 Tax=Mya arenaria TaxID=6604 RepID=UPI0022E2E8C2|nr:aquaporin-3-like isoform X3 [Mya arenaria]
MMKPLTLQRIGRIRNKWITDAMSEILCTFMLALFVYASGAQSILSHGEASTVPGRALAAGAGLMIAVYCGINASEMINTFDGGVRQVYGDQATVSIFTSFPSQDISTGTGFFDIFVGCGLLTGCTCMLIDPNNANAAPGVVPIALALMLYGIIMGFGVQTGAPINLSIDFSGRLFAFFAGYGADVFRRDNYWFWVPPTACISGTITFVTTYQLMIGNHLPDNNPSTGGNSADSTNCDDRVNGIDGIHGQEKHKYSVNELNKDDQWTLSNNIVTKI